MGPPINCILVIPSEITLITVLAVALSAVAVTSAFPEIAPGLKVAIAKPSASVLTQGVTLQPSRSVVNWITLLAIGFWLLS
jgi:hypothetical protein